jgi:hypothetical protein
MVTATCVLMEPTNILEISHAMVYAPQLIMQIKQEDFVRNVISHVNNVMEPMHKIAYLV